MTFSVVIGDINHTEDYLTILQHEGYTEDNDSIKLMLTRQIIEEDEDDRNYYEEMHAITVNYKELLRAIDAVAVNK